MFRHLRLPHGLSEQELAQLFETMAGAHVYFQQYHDGQNQSDLQDTFAEHREEDDQKHAEPEGEESYDDCCSTDEEWHHTEADL